MKKKPTKMFIVFLLLITVFSYGQISFNCGVSNTETVTDPFSRFSSGDIDADGDPDIIAISDRKLTIFFNENGYFNRRYSPYPLGRVTQRMCCN
jgi:hypothetical protein